MGDHKQTYIEKQEYDKDLGAQKVTLKRYSGPGECDHAHHPVSIRRVKSHRRRHDVQIVKPMRFVSLHHHSTFSALDGYALPAAHARRATELGMSALAMTEHGNTSSHVKLEMAAIEHGIKPLFGCEIYMGKVGEGATQRKYHLTVLAATDEGYRNLITMVSKAWAEGFYYEPTVSWEMLKQYKKGLIILSGCQGSLLFCSMVGGKLISEEQANYKRARKVAQLFKREFGDAYYLECQAFPELSKTCEFNPLAEKLAADLRIGLVATMDCHYTIPEESEIQAILHNVRGGGRKTLEEQSREWGYDTYLCPPPNDRSLYRALRETGLSSLAAQQAIINTEIINERIDHITLPKLPMVRYPLPDGYDNGLQLWRDWIKQGWKFRDVPNLPKAPAIEESYKERLQREIKVIEDKDFIDYFLITSDMVKFAKDSGIPVGPARGSAAASLVCYLLRITEVNPMLYDNLVFERFIDETRMDLPDIDLDFDSDRRHEVREYLVAKYGEGRVSNIGTFNYYKSKNSLDDVARVFRIPGFKVDVVKDLMVQRSSGDLRASATIEDTAEQFTEVREVFEEYPDLAFAMELEGNVRGIGVHSAGLVISNGPITDVCAVYAREVKGVMTEVISFDKKDAERQGLIKMDVLGLSTMAMLAEGMRHLGMSVDDLYSIKLDDEKVIDGFRRNDVTGIFQFDGRATRLVNEGIKPDNFREICDINALSRPGPLHNGAALAYIEIKRGAREPILVHPALDLICADTRYQIIYQEQILRIVREIGDFEWTHAAYIRKIISQKLGDGEFNRQWQRFWDGAQRMHPDMSEEKCQEIWGLCITAGSYAFNAAHTVSYGMLAFWTMWMKQYHPAVFYAASLAKMPATKQEELLRDALKKEIKVKPPHPKHSGATWRPSKSGIRAGFGQIPGIGPKVTERVLEFREQGSLKQWGDLVAIPGIGPKTVDKIVEFAAADDPFRIAKLDDAIARAQAALEAAGLPKCTHTSRQIPYTKGSSDRVTWAGVLQKKNIRDIYEANQARGHTVDMSQIKDPHLHEKAVLHGWDGEELVLLLISRYIYPKFKQAIFETKLNHDVIMIIGRKASWCDGRMVQVDDMWVVDPYDDEE